MKRSEPLSLHPPLGVTGLWPSLRKRDPRPGCPRRPTEALPNARLKRVRKSGYRPSFEGLLVLRGRRLLSAPPPWLGLPGSLACALVAAILRVEAETEIVHLRLQLLLLILRLLLDLRHVAACFAEPAFDLSTGTLASFRRCLGHDHERSGLCTLALTGRCACRDPRRTRQTVQPPRCRRPVGGCKATAWRCAALRGTGGKRDHRLAAGLTNCRARNGRVRRRMLALAHFASCSA
jgi:hypothetical protein